MNAYQLARKRELDDLEANDSGQRPDPYTVAIFARKMASLRIDLDSDRSNLPRYSATELMGDQLLLHDFVRCRGPYHVVWNFPPESAREFLFVIDPGFETLAEAEAKAAEYSS